MITWRGSSKSGIVKRTFAESWFRGWLRKQKIKFGLEEKARCIEFFGCANSKIEPLTTQVIHSEEQLNRFVNGLYGLTDDEVQVVEDTLLA